MSTASEQTAIDDAATEIMLQPEQIQEIIGKIELSGVLGRSKLYANLLRYLCGTYIDGTVPKEIVIAIEVMGKSSDFDVKNDSLVRVYMHKLRQKLSEYYSKHGRDDLYQISIPKGQYALLAHAQHSASGTPAESQAELQQPIHTGETKSKKTLRLPLLVVLTIFSGLLAANLFYSVFNTQKTGDSNPYLSVSQHPVWAPLLADDEPLIVVIGDYFIFAEHINEGDSNRFIREHHINSPTDLDRYKQSSEGTEDFHNLNMSYLPRAAAFAMKDILPILSAAGKSVTIRMSSDIKGSDLKSQHILYIGSINAMGELRSFAFQESNFAIGRSYDEIIHKATGKVHTSGELDPANHGDSFYDFGMISSLPMLDGHQMMFISGTRDTGIMHMAHILSDERYLETMTSSLDTSGQPEKPLSFEAFYRVIGYDGLNFDAEKIHVGPLDYKRIWGGEMMDVLQ